MIKKLLEKTKLLYIGLFVTFLLIAGLLDVKYEGLLFQLLPGSVQAYLAGIFH